MHRLVVRKQTYYSEFTFTLDKFFKKDLEPPNLYHALMSS